jgi:DNA-binding CsgD family transcriptional regulator
MSVTNHFFDPVRDMKYSTEMDYDIAKKRLSPLIVTSQFSNQAVYVIDFYRREFMYFSPHPLLLCGHEVEYVLNKGFAFFEEIVPPEDLNMLVEISRKGFEFFYNLPISKRHGCYISYDFRIIHPRNRCMLVNHILVPYWITEYGDLWLAVCFVSRSVNGSPGNIFIQLTDEPANYMYSFKEKKFISSERGLLSGREKQVLELLTLGECETKISERIFVSMSAVKHIKKNIFTKLGVPGTREAIAYARANKII